MPADTWSQPSHYCQPQTKICCFYCCSVCQLFYLYLLFIGALAICGGGETMQSSGNLNSLARSQEHWVFFQRRNLLWVLRTAIKFGNQCKNIIKHYGRKVVLCVPRTSCITSDTIPSEATLASALSKSNELCILDMIYHLEDTTWSRETSRLKVSGVPKAETDFDINCSHPGLQPEFSGHKKINRPKMFPQFCSRSKLANWECQHLLIAAWCSSPSEPTKALWKRRQSWVSLTNLLASLSC